jgi:hypothetical protein
MADHPPGPPQPDPASASLESHELGHNSLHSSLPGSTAMMTPATPPPAYNEPRSSPKYKGDATRHRCDIAFCRQRQPNMRKVKKPKSDKQMERYCQIWTQIGGYPEGVNDTGKLVTSKAQFYFCPEHIKPRGDGRLIALFKASTCTRFFLLVLAC